MSSVKSTAASVASVTTMTETAPEKCTSTNPVAGNSAFQNRTARVSGDSGPAVSTSGGGPIIRNPTDDDKKIGNVSYRKSATTSATNVCNAATTQGELDSELKSFDTSLTDNNMSVLEGKTTDDVSDKESKYVLLSPAEAVTRVGLVDDKPGVRNACVTTSVTVAKTELPVAPNETQVVKSVYTTKTGNSTRIFTVETTTDSVTRRNSTAVFAGIVAPSIEISVQPEISTRREASNNDFNTNTSSNVVSVIPIHITEAPDVRENQYEIMSVTNSIYMDDPCTDILLRTHSTPRMSRTYSANQEILGLLSKRASQSSEERIQCLPRKDSTVVNVKDVFSLEPPSKTDISSSKSDLSHLELSKKTDTFPLENISKTVHSSEKIGTTPSEARSAQVSPAEGTIMKTEVTSSGALSKNPEEPRKQRTWRSWSRTDAERERGLAGMEFCAFLFRKGRVRPRAVGPHRGARSAPPFSTSPPSTTALGPTSPLIPATPCAPGDEMCVAVVASSVDASAAEVIDNRSKNVEHILEALKKGTQLWKIRSFTKWYRRSYYLDDKEGTVRYEPSHKAPCRNSPLRIAVDDIVDVRKGWKTDTFNKIEKKVEQRRIKFPSQPSPVDERCCFSIIYSNNKQSLDLCAPEPKIADMWVRGLRHIVTVLKGLHQEERFERWLEQQFYEADVDKNNGLNFEESLKLLKQLNVKMPRSSVKKIFDEANTVKHSRNGEEVIDADEFVAFYMKLMSRSEIKEIYLRYCKNNKEMTVSDLIDFIHKEQKGHETTKEECLSLIEAFEQSNLKTEGKLSLIGFTNMLMSEQFDVLKQHHKVVYQDMHQPLSHYYIATSHNTYLTGNQLHGESSVEGYIDALKQGCRCVELDCWDGPEGDPIVYHGYTLTSRILFRDILVDAIKPYAFYSSEYPVILSLENHLSPKQQEVLTKHLIEVLGDMLYTTPVNESWEFLPSPEDLKKKVIVKAKKKASSVNPNGDEDSNSEDEAQPPPGVQHVSNAIAKGKTEVAPGLSSLVNVCEAVHFHSFEDTEANQKCYQMSSFSEAKATKLCTTNGAEFVKYNTKHLSRIYPAGKRTDSSNFIPVPFWNVGCQLVALNYQHAGKPMLYNDAKFQDNGGCGYVLKPEYLRKKGYDPDSTLSDRNQITLKLTVISGQHIPKADQNAEGEIVDPYVKVKILGHLKDNQKLKTEAVRNNGFNPIWNNEMTFNINMPELAIIHFIVKDLSNTGKDVTLGTYAIPFLSLQQGYSHVYLKDYNRNFVSPASLFIHVCVL